jgi:hypothetical protein
MEAHNRLELVVRIGEQTYKFIDIVMRYTVDRDEFRIVEFKRKDGFVAWFS